MPKPQQWVIMEHQGHTPGPAWKDITPEDCVYELAARCRNCQEGQFCHFEKIDVDALFAKHGERWPYAYFKDDLEWNTEVGICGACMERIRLMAQGEISNFKTRIIGRRN